MAKWTEKPTKRGHCTGQGTTCFIIGGFPCQRVAERSGPPEWGEKLSTFRGRQQAFFGYGLAAAEWIHAMEKQRSTYCGGAEAKCNTSWALHGEEPGGRMTERATSRM